jgi:glycosyltransferase involved in cell wall biosynthesis
MLSSAGFLKNQDFLYDTRKSSPEYLPEATIIVPVYNVAPYIEDCLNSVFSHKQSVDLEIIIIDDGSKDDSSSMIWRILKRLNPDNTVFIAQGNRGLSSVRNYGVSIAAGRYIAFLDSDDLLSGGALRILLDFAIRENCDIVLGKSMVFDSKDLSVHPFYDANIWDLLLCGSYSRVVSKFEDAKLFLLEPNVNYRLIRRDLFECPDLLFPEGRLYEDTPVHLMMLAISERTGLVNTPYYWYRVSRPGKITNQRSTSRFDAIEVVDEYLKIVPALYIPQYIGSSIACVLFRSIWWCGTMTLPEHRMQYMVQACKVLRAHLPKEWAKHCLDNIRPEYERQIPAFHAFMDGDIDKLIELSYE